MQTRVDRRVFERTDFGSFGWLKEGPATPLYETAFFAAIEAFSKQSVRTVEGLKLESHFHLETPIFSMWFQGGSGRIVPIDGANTAVLTMQYESIMIVSNNATGKWWIL